MLKSSFRKLLPRHFRKQTTSTIPLAYQLQSQYECYAPIDNQCDVHLSPYRPSTALDKNPMYKNLLNDKTLSIHVQIASKRLHNLKVVMLPPCQQTNFTHLPSYLLVCKTKLWRTWPIFSESVLLKSCRPSRFNFDSIWALQHVNPWEHTCRCSPVKNINTQSEQYIITMTNKQ